MAKTRLWVTISLLMEVEPEGPSIPLAETARAWAWEKLQNTDEPPECMIEIVQTEEEYNETPHGPSQLMESDEAYDLWASGSEPNSADSALGNHLLTADDVHPIALDGDGAVQL
jgi:hypothetical protein